MLKILQAHGLDAGPMQRPLLTGVVAGMVADIPALALFQGFETLHALGRAANCSDRIAALAFVGLMLLGGALYGWLFQRAANDPWGGWLFGLSYGFVLWMLGPIPLLQWLPSKPIMTGYPAIGLLLGQWIWGLFLGIVFPFVDRLLRTNLNGQVVAHTAGTGPQAACDPHLRRRS